MNIGEANQVNLVLRALLDLRDNPHAIYTQAEADDVAAAAIGLADRAHKTLYAGVDGDKVRSRWPKPKGWPTKRSLG